MSENHCSQKADQFKYSCLGHDKLIGRFSSGILFLKMGAIIFCQLQNLKVEFSVGVLYFC